MSIHHSLFADLAAYYSRKAADQVHMFGYGRAQNAAALVASGLAAPFHFCISNLHVNGVELPVLGVFVFKDAIEIDYRMGPHWGPAEVEAFFGLLREICEFTPGAMIRPADCEGPPNSERFSEAWTEFLKHTGASDAR